ncbi:MAG: MnmC family methyltransferase [Chthoniobacter sp.]|uniref:MnmC family methyltransferase n=1 Tax=Chthoniobacter sp. TaxID=2510640 RepID=UPI0032A7E70E
MDNDPAAFEIVTVQSGARSLRSRNHGETFHPVVGPMIEAVALHVRQQRLVERAAAEEGTFVIWDVGLGAAANAIAAIEALAQQATTGLDVEIHSFDVTDGALRFALSHAADLGYLVPHVATIETLLAVGESAETNIRWKFHPGDFRETMFAAPAPHAVLYDPYSPQSNPDMWTLDHFTQMRTCLSPEVTCLLTNYTRSTAVRVTLLLAGFFVGHGHATGEKDQTTIASNDLAMLEEPLDAAWLKRVHRSTNAAPLRSTSAGIAPISPEDWARLSSHPQFAS